MVPVGPNADAATVVPFLSAVTVAPVVGLSTRKPPSSQAPPPLASAVEAGPTPATAAVSVSAVTASNRRRLLRMVDMGDPFRVVDSRSVRSTASSGYRT